MSPTTVEVVLIVVYFTGLVTVLIWDPAHLAARKAEREANRSPNSPNPPNI